MEIEKKQYNKLIESSLLNVQRRFGCSLEKALELILKSVGDDSDEDSLSHVAMFNEGYLNIKQNPDLFVSTTTEEDLKKYDFLEKFF